MPLLALPQVIVVLHPLTVVPMAWTWAVISRSAVTKANTAPTSMPGSTARTTISFWMSALLCEELTIEFFVAFGCLVSPRWSASYRQSDLAPLYILVRWSPSTPIYDKQSESLRADIER